MLVALLLVILGLVVQDQYNFAKDYVKTELGAQKITFAAEPTDEETSWKPESKCLTVRVAVVRLLRGGQVVVPVPWVSWLPPAAITPTAMPMTATKTTLVVGRLGGAYLMFFLPLIDIGIFQDPMFISGEQAVWMKLLPGFGGTRLVIDAGFGSATGDWVALSAAGGWALLLGAAALLLFSR